MKTEPIVNWRVARDEHNIAWLDFDQAGSATNVLSAPVLDELAGVIADLRAQAPRGLVIRSAKDSGFVAGADIGEFTKIASPADAKAMIKRGWDLFNAIAALPFPTLALIRGFCLGGGLELALACRYRIVVDDPKTRLGLPEVMLGIWPLMGGVQRLPRTIAPTAALDMMLTGRTLDARRAHKLGLADACVPARVMENAARQFMLDPPAPRVLPWSARLQGWGPVRAFIASKARQQVAKRARPEHYPAPYAIIRAWSRYDGDPFAIPDDDPASVVHLVQHPTAQNLIRVFFLQERLKGLGKTGDYEAKHVHVVGAGSMGGDIAAWCALRGLRVTLQDQDAQRLAPAMKRAAKLFGERIRDERRRRDAFDRLIPDVAGDGVAQADVIIEAIFENLEAKQNLFAALEAKAKPDAILATNTSSIPLEDIARNMRAPERLIGLHFFNPVAKMMLVEIVVGRATREALKPLAAAFVRQIDKLPLPVKSAPGFLVNRILAPYLMAAMRCVDEGIAPEAIDRAALAFGMPMGPIELADSVGLDICFAVGKMLEKDTAPPRKLAELIAAGNVGKKSGQGFYPWPKGKPVKQPVSDAAIPAGLANRLIQPMLAEAQAALAEHIVDDADLLDAGAIFGTGFAPFRGGPMHFIQTGMNEAAAGAA
jgi:3-hydroxyacyl-CoA dehydrogenase/enoyl-CoA hydratase/3-hydroxybutyryl-CoA epimerase